MVAKSHFDLEQWLHEIKALLSALTDIDLGYPIEENFIRQPAQMLNSQLSQHGNLPSDLRDFYNLCDGIDLPDVNNGYFIHSVQWIEESSRKGEPQFVSANSTYPVIVFGSDGGGGRFALRSDAQDEVLYLASGGSVVDSVFKGVAKPIGTFNEFLDGLLNSFQAFISMNEG